jgi:hypothetical protein
MPGCQLFSRLLKAGKFELCYWVLAGNNLNQPNDATP